MDCRGVQTSTMFTLVLGLCKNIFKSLKVLALQFRWLFLDTNVLFEFTKQWYKFFSEGRGIDTTIFAKLMDKKSNQLFVFYALFCLINSILLGPIISMWFQNLPHVMIHLYHMLCILTSIQVLGTTKGWSKSFFLIFNLFCWF